MAMTMATIGRRMKNFDISYLPAALVAEATVAGAGCGVDGSALAKLLQVVDDDLRARSKAAFYQPVVADLGPEFDRGEMGFIVAARDIDLLQTLQFLHRNLRDEQGIVTQLRLASDTAELAGAENVVGIGEHGSDADGAGLCVHLAIDELDVTLQGIDLAVGQCQREGNGGFTFEQVAAGARARVGSGPGIRRR